MKRHQSISEDACQVSTETPADPLISTSPSLHFTTILSTHQSSSTRRSVRVSRGRDGEQAMTKSIITGKAAAEFLAKAAAALRGKAGALRARLLLLASLRRRAAVVAALSRQIRALTPTSNKQARRQDQAAPAGVSSRAMTTLSSSRPADGDTERASATTTTPAGSRDVGDGAVGVGMAELAILFEEVDADAESDGGHQKQDPTLALSYPLVDDDDKDGSVEGGGDGGHNVDDEASVIELIRSRREGEGKEFRVDDEIDRAADMFIARVRRRQRMSVERGV